MKIKTTRWAIQRKSDDRYEHFSGVWRKKPNENIILHQTLLHAQLHRIYGERVVPVKVEMEVGE